MEVRLFWLLRWVTRFEFMFDVILKNNIQVEFRHFYLSLVQFQIIEVAHAITEVRACKSFINYLVIVLNDNTFIIIN